MDVKTGEERSDRGLVALVTQLSKALHRRSTDELLGMRLKAYMALGYIRDHPGTTQQELENRLGMAERDRAPVWIELLAERIDADAARRGDHLGRKRLVDLDYVDVVDAHLGPLQRLLRGVDGAQPHELGLER